MQCLRCYSTSTSCQLVHVATARRAVGPIHVDFAGPFLGNMKERTMDFLRDYCSCPNCASGRTPTELVIDGEYELRSLFYNHQYLTKRSNALVFGDHVFVRSYVYRRDIDQMRHRVNTALALVRPPVDELCLPTSLRAASPPRSPILETPMRDRSPTDAEDERIVSPPRYMPAVPLLRRSARNCRPPTRYSPQ